MPVQMTMQRVVCYRHLQFRTLISLLLCESAYGKDTTLFLLLLLLAGQLIQSCTHSLTENKGALTIIYSSIKYQDKHMEYLMCLSTCVCV